MTRFVTMGNLEFQEFSERGAAVHSLYIVCWVKYIPTIHRNIVHCNSLFTEREVKYSFALVTQTMHTHFPLAQLHLNYCFHKYEVFKGTAH